MATDLSLIDSLEKVEGIGKISANKLASANFLTINDLLTHYPTRYLEFHTTTTSSSDPGDFVILEGNISNPYSKGTGRISTQSATFKDVSGSLALRWFNQPYLARSIKSSSTYQIRGKVELFNNNKQIVNPQIITNFSSNDKSEFVAIYPQIAGLSSKWIRTKILKILASLEKIADPLPAKIRKSNNLIGRVQALNNIHTPNDLSDIEPAIYRLSFEELYLLQLAALKAKQSEPSSATIIKTDKKSLDEFYSKLEFQLTNSQLQSITEILADMNKPSSMRRLLQGDVGTGKTIVSIALAYIAARNGLQTVVMAPTQILAEQLHSTYEKYLASFGYKVALMTGKVKPKTNYDILIGTNAVLNELESNLDKVGLVIIDEQHKFGVKQRKQLENLPSRPHMLTMTATPIPRSLALTLFNDLNISYLTDQPSNRIPIKTYFVPESKRLDSYSWITKLAKDKGYQTFVVSPLIEASEYDQMKHLKSAQETYQTLKKALPTLNIGLLHGKLKNQEKTDIINDFRSKMIDVLVATTVIEVGIDIPEANIIIIESAERFGLSQLHQLRGRVGRSDQQGHCLVFTSKPDTPNNTRLNYFVKHTDGKKLADLDMQLRGPGQIWGTRQHGFFNLKIASIYDTKLLELTHAAALSSLAN